MGPAGIPMKSGVCVSASRPPRLRQVMLLIQIAATASLAVSTAGRSNLGSQLGQLSPPALIAPPLAPGAIALLPWELLTAEGMRIPAHGITGLRGRAHFGLRGSAEDVRIEGTGGTGMASRRPLLPDVHAAACISEHGNLDHSGFPASSLTEGADTFVSISATPPCPEMHAAAERISSLAGLAPHVAEELVRSYPKVRFALRPAPEENRHAVGGRWIESTKEWQGRELGLEHEGGGADCNLERVFRYLRAVGVRECALAKMLRQRPQLMCLKVESAIRPKVQFLVDEAGLSPSDVGKVLERFPHVITLSVSAKLRPTLRFLRNLGLAVAQVGDMLVSCPQIFAYSLVS